MRFLLFFFFTSTFFSHAFLWAQEPKSNRVVELELARVLKEVRSINAKSYCMDPSLQNSYEEPYIRFNMSFKENGLCDGEMDFKKICSVADYSCNPQFMKCFYPIESRNQNFGLQNRVYEHLAQFFEKVTHSEPYLSSCCGEDEYCRESFSKTKIKILKGLPTDSQTAFYNAVEKTVKISESMALGHVAKVRS